MPSLRIGQTEVPYELRRTATLSERRITVTPGRVEVLALASDDEATINGFLQRKRQWLFETLREMDEALAKRPVVPRLMSGSKIPFRGRLWRLTVRRHDSDQVSVRLRNGFVVDLPSSVSTESAEGVVALHLKLWLKRQARLDARAIARHHGARFGLAPAGVRVGEFRSGWGSCTPTGVLHLDWRLIFAPKTVLEYVVVHELAHLRERTHGASFWNLVAAILPDYERPRAWLDIHQARLDAGFLALSFGARRS